MYKTFIVLRNYRLQCSYIMTIDVFDIFSEKTCFIIFCLKKLIKFSSFKLKLLIDPIAGWESDIRLADTVFVPFFSV